jgi:hypothetical protein
MLDAAEALKVIVLLVAPTFQTFAFVSLSNIIHPCGTCCKPWSKAVADVVTVIVKRFPLKNIKGES